MGGLGRKERTCAMFLPCRYGSEGFGSRCREPKSQIRAIMTRQFYNNLEIHKTPTGPVYERWSCDTRDRKGVVTLDGLTTVASWNTRRFKQLNTKYVVRASQPFKDQPVGGDA